MNLVTSLSSYSRRFHPCWATACNKYLFLLIDRLQDKLRFSARYRIHQTAAWIASKEITNTALQAPNTIVDLVEFSRSSLIWKLRISERTSAYGHEISLS